MRRIQPDHEIIKRHLREEAHTRYNLLCKRYSIHRATLWRWCNEVGLIRSQNGNRVRHFQPSEQIELDLFYVGCKAEWGVRLPTDYYVNEILDQDLTLDDYLQSDYRYSCSFEDYLRWKNQEWLLAPEIELMKAHQI